MIIRIATEGQFRLDDAMLSQLNAMDNHLVQLIQTGDEGQFRTALNQLLDFVRQHGQPVSPEEILESDLILPPPDISLEEARELFKDEGLIPG
ncbi:PspA-associated protein PspAA [Thermorudis peleae]|uniref:PspA-associated protein PspAA n=1 Tax=Thermorudis peleae TaxID=1382356 RepID=UPI0005702760|nr:hypothetical protein [Thermorudis peleae]